MRKGTSQSKKGFEERAVKEEEKSVMSHVYEDTMMKCITSFSSPKKVNKSERRRKWGGRKSERFKVTLTLVPARSSEGWEG